MEWKSNSHIKAALEILRREFQPSQVYLFGSRANGAVSLDSDIDLLLVIPETEESRLSRQLRAHEFVANIKAVSFDIFIYTKEEFDLWKDQLSSIPETALNTGREIRLG